MKLKFYGWASILVISLLIIGLCIRKLSLQGIHSSDALILRGLSCFFIVLIFSKYQKLSLIPKSIKTQFYRAIIAGIALNLLNLSYKWLTASSVAILTNIDVPFLVILGPLIGIQASRQARLLSLISVLFLVWYVTILEFQINLFYGLSSLMSGTLLLCFGYLYLKKSMKDENKAVAILTPSLAIIFCGLIENFIFSFEISSAWDEFHIAISVLSGIGMFLAYIATMKLYEVADLAVAEFPTLISSIIIQPAELLFLNEPINSIFLIASIGFTAMTFFINLEKYSTKEVLSVQ